MDNINDELVPPAIVGDNIAVDDLEAATIVNDVLQDNGYSNLTTNNTVVQREGSIIVVPESNHTNTMDAVPVATSIDTPLSDLIEEVFGTVEDTVASNPYEEPVDINVEEVINDTDDILNIAIENALADSTPSDSTPINTNKEDLLTMLPTNLKSLEIRESTARFSGAEWFSDLQEQTIIVAGIGGIGSNLLYPLSRVRPKQIFIYDDDTVELVNLAGQLYSTDVIGKKKVDAISTIISKLSDYHSIMAIPEKWTNSSEPGDIMICGFDNMEARKAFFTSWLRKVTNHPHPEKCLFIDGRLAFSEMQVFCITGDDTYNINKYNNEYLFSDSEAEATVCSMKQTTYCASIIGGIIVNLITNFIANLRCPLSHDLPFKTFYDSTIMYFKTES